MHELGIVFYIIRDVKQVAQENSVAKVSKVVRYRPWCLNTSLIAGDGQPTRKKS